MPPSTFSKTGLFLDHRYPERAGLLHQESPHCQGSRAAPRPPCLRRQDCHLCHHFQHRKDHHQARIRRRNQSHQGHHGQRFPLKFEVQGHCDSTDEGCVKNRRVELVRNKSTRVLAVEPATCNSVVSANRHVSGVQLVTRLWSFSRIGLYPGYTLLHVYSHFRVSACTPGLLAREGGDIGLRAQKHPQIVSGRWNNRPPGTKSHPKRARNVKLFVY